MKPTLAECIILTLQKPPGNETWNIFHFSISVPRQPISSIRAVSNLRFRSATAHQVLLFTSTDTNFHLPKSSVMSEIVANTVLTAARTPRNSPLHLLSLPVETRRQILSEAFIGEIEERQPYPLGRKSLPFDRPLHPIFSRNEVLKLEKQVWGQSSFWGKEPMTRIMRDSKQLYAEIYQILWSDFALHVASPNPLHGAAVLDWLDTYNPRAFEAVKHLHVR